MSDLPTKYRPKSFDDVIGQKAVVTSLRRLSAQREKHSFCFTGPSGCGKTTLARITARAVGVGDLDLLEIDAATHTGIDHWRDLLPRLQYAPMGPAGSSRAIIVDEAHRLSKQAWDSMLKAVEEPPSHLFWMFCTTEPTKVPVAIRNRCAAMALGRIHDDAVFDLLDGVCTAESYDVTDSLLNMITAAANGSPRQALSFLETCHDQELDQAAELLQTVADDRKPLELAVGLLNKTLDWPAAVRITASLQDRVPAETIRRIMLAVMYKSLLNKTNPTQAVSLLAVIEAFERPFASDDKAAAVLVPMGRLLLV